MLAIALIVSFIILCVVFVSNEHVGQIRQTENSSPAFVMGKSRKPLDADTLRAIATKMEVMKNG